MGIELSGQLERISRENDRRTHAINSILAILLAIILIWAAWAAWRNARQPKIEAITIVTDSVRVLSASDLCPGESLQIGYSVEIDGLGIVIFDDSIQHRDYAVKFSNPRRVIVQGPVTFSMEYEWTIPPRPDMMIDDKHKWAPGNYERFIAIGASNSYISRYVQPAILKIPFEIRSDCDG